MFKAIYSCPLTVARHENGPLHESRRRYLEHLSKEGASRSMLLRASAVMYRAAVRMKLDESSPVAEAAVAKAAKEWANRSDGNPNRRVAKYTEREFRQIASDWLRFLDRLPPHRAAVQHQTEIDAFCLYLEKERGLASASIQSMRIHLQTFFRNTPERLLNNITIHEIERFLKRKYEAGCTRAGLSSFIWGLRSFFNYGERQGWTKPGIGAQLHGPRMYRYEQLPQGPTWTDVQRLLSTTETDRAVDIRDRAVLLLFAVYGLRAGEVERIRLEDFNWEHRTLTIPRTKQRQARLCPLIPSLAEAVARYIREARPACNYPELFLRYRAPHRPFRHGGMYRIVRRRLDHLGISCPSPGPHGLRHACATHLLAQGLTLTEVGGHLGHRSLATTDVYAKVDMPTLRAVADLDLGGLL
jgi:integrase/recombinase XerD